MLPNLPAIIAITRLNRPIGSLLLLWPTYWALWLAAEGSPSLFNLIIFSLGVLVMRSAGCVANDLADRHVDGHVKRTQARPLVTGMLSLSQARNLLLLLLALALMLVLLLGPLLLLWSLPALALAMIYPFMKRYTHLPQLVLGLAFSWAIPMAFVAQSGQMPMIAWLVFIANALWTVAYDTQYAMVDRDDDLKIGVKSTAILFGQADRAIVLCLQMLMLCSLLLYGLYTQLAWPYYIGLILTLSHFTWQWHFTRNRSRERCFRAFLANNYSGLIIFTSILVSFWPSLI